jgi:hypothetical protein
MHLVLHLELLEILVQVGQMELVQQMEIQAHIHQA